MHSRKSTFWIMAAVITAMILLLPHAAMAAPGGQIASALFRSLPGKILLGILCIVLAPFIISVMVQEAKAEKLARKSLSELAVGHAEFDWMGLKLRVTEVFTRVHAAWRKEDMQEASDWMTHWYWQNQQLAYLDQWERDGLVNHCRVSAIKNIKPLYVLPKEANGASDGSRVVVSINANMEDYLANRITGAAVKGKPGYDDVESVWTFIYENGRWLVENIEEGTLSLQYAKLMNDLASKRVKDGVRATNRG